MAPAWVAPVVANVLLFALITGISASVEARKVKEQFRRGCGLTVGLVCQFVLLPFLGFCVVTTFQLPDVLGVALLAVTASPGGAYSNWWCSLFNADLALSVAMTTCSTFASIVMTPLNLLLWMSLAYGQSPSVQWIPLIASIAVAATAITCGLGLNTWRPDWHKVFGMIGNLAGLCLIVFSTMVSLTAGGKKKKSAGGQEPALIVAAFLPCVLGLLLAFGLGKASRRLSGPEIVAVTVETSYQNTGLALTIALASFDEDKRGKAAAVPLLYGIAQVVLLPLFLLIAWKSGMTYAPKGDGIRSVVMGNYQPHTLSDVQDAVMQDLDAKQVVCSDNEASQSEVELGHPLDKAFPSDFDVPTAAAGITHSLPLPGITQSSAIGETAAESSVSRMRKGSPPPSMITDSPPHSDADAVALPSLSLPDDSAEPGEAPPSSAQGPAPGHPHFEV